MAKKRKSKVSNTGCSGTTKPVEPKPVEPKRVKLSNRMKKRNIFLADSVRDERDKTFINNELHKREYKNKIAKVTTIKYYQLVDEMWQTDFIIELKE